MPTENVWLTSTLKEMLHEPAVADAEKNAIAELLMESIEKLMQFGENKTPAILAADIHTGVDRLINVRRKNPASESEKITCRKGCAHCCSQIVACSGIEAVLLAQVGASKVWRSIWPSWSSRAGAMMPRGWSSLQKIARRAGASRRHPKYNVPRRGPRGPRGRGRP